MSRIFLIAAFSLLATGCASRGTVSQASKLAEAGIAYGAASAEVIPLTRDRYLAWSTESLIEESQDLAHCTTSEVMDEAGRSRACQDAMSDFDQTYRQYRVFVDRMFALQAHAEALSRYFGQLKALADYDSNSAAAGAAGRLIDRINDLSAVLEPDAKLSDAQKDAWSAMAGLVGDAIKAARLRARLEADADDIARAIDIQDGVLKASKATIEAIDIAERELVFQRDVRASYLSGEVEDTAAWQASLRASLLPGPAIAPLQALETASSGLQDVWRAILTGQGTLESAQMVLDDIAASLKAIDDIRRANAPAKEGE